MSIFRDFFVKEKPVFTGIARSVGGFGFGLGFDASSGGEKLYADDVFSTYLYEGNSSTQTITNGIDLAGEGGLVWIKNRNTLSKEHVLTDTVRGISGYALSTNSTAAALTYEMVTAFNSDGFSINNIQAVNESSINYASWTFRKAPGFFDVVTYTGDGTSSRNIAHNLGSVPGFVAIKRLDNTSDWVVWHRSLSLVNTSQGLRLNGTDAFDTPSGGGSVWSSTTPMTSTTFGVASSQAGDWNTNLSGATYVAYLFAHDDASFGTNEDESIIKCGTYTGSSLQEINIGFEPQLFLTKCTSRFGTGYGWTLLDNMRLKVIAPNTSSPEFGSQRTEFRPGGVKFNSNDSDINEGGETYIYMAIRRPHKPPTAATEVFDAAVQTASSGATPSFVSGNIVDAAFRRDLGIDGWNLASRLTGTARLRPDTTDNEGTLGSRADYTWDYMTGWRTGTASSTTYSWMFRRAPGFFDVVTWTGAGSDQNVNHNLKVIPEMVITKMRDYSGPSATYGGDRWYVYHKDLGGSGISAYDSILGLNQSGGQISSSNGGIFSSAPTSTILPFSNPSYDSLAVTGASDTYVGYLFATLPGISKVGSYSGTGSNIDVDCGFTAGARFVLIKRSDSTGDWYVWDTERGIVSGNDPYLLLNSDAAEVTTTDYIDPLNAGFTVTSSAPAALNASGGSYIFLAIA